MPPTRRSESSSSNRPSGCEGLRLEEEDDGQTCGVLFTLLRRGDEDGLAAWVQQRRSAQAEDGAAARGGGGACAGGGGATPDAGLGGFLGGGFSNQSDEYAGSETPFTYLLKQASSSSSPPH
jgi:hypothetical protein